MADELTQTTFDATIREIYNSILNRQLETWGSGIKIEWAKYKPVNKKKLRRIKTRKVKI